MNDEIAQKLRKPFDADQIGKLPRLTCKACRESQTKACSQHPKANCQVCGNWISPKHIHLDYVGHAATTDRLLQADPEWTWKPFGADELVGVNAQKGELWIWLTISGTTRPGVGDGDTAKVRIGDAIRNAAMRFGVALDLWAKEDLHSDDATVPPKTAAATTPNPPAPETDAGGSSPYTDPAPPQSVLEEIDTLVTEYAAMLGKDRAAVIKKMESGPLTKQWRMSDLAAGAVLTKLRKAVADVAAGKVTLPERATA